MRTTSANDGQHWLRRSGQAASGQVAHVLQNTQRKLPQGPTGPKHASQGQPLGKSSHQDKGLDPNPLCRPGLPERCPAGCMNWALPGPAVKTLCPMRQCKSMNSEPVHRFPERSAEMPPHGTGRQRQGCTQSQSHATCYPYRHTYIANRALWYGVWGCAALDPVHTCTLLKPRTSE